MVRKGTTALPKAEIRGWCPGALRSLRGRFSQVKDAYGVASDGAARHP